MADGLEPHDLIYSWDTRGVQSGTLARCGEGVPGVVRQVGTGRVYIPGTTQPSQIEAYLTVFKI